MITFHISNAPVTVPFLLYIKQSISTIFNSFILSIADWKLYLWILCIYKLFHLFTIEAGKFGEKLNLLRFEVELSTL